MSVGYQLAEELHKLVIRKLKTRKQYVIFKDNISAADLGGMESLSEKNESVKYLLCVIDDFIKYACMG